jgi:hypothetical protein
MALCCERAVVSKTVPHSESPTQHSVARCLPIAVPVQPWHGSGLAVPQSPHNSSLSRLPSPHDADKCPPKQALVRHCMGLLPDATRNPVTAGLPGIM